MNDYVTDEEQVEKIKRWWSENGTSVIAGVVLGVGGLFGWRFWVDYQDNYAANASVHFSVMSRALENGQQQKIIDEANVILDEYQSSAYAAMAHLALAKAYVSNQEFNRAEQQLNRLLADKPDLPIEMVTRKRLALVLIQQNKLDQALQTLNVDYPQQFQAAFEELKGDILSAQGKQGAARDAYLKAKLAQPQVADPRFLQQKMDDLGNPVSEG